MPRPIRFTLLGLATAAYLVALARLTLGAQPTEATGSLHALADWFAGSPVTAWVTFPVLEFAANIALFVPAGVLGVLWFGARRWWIAVVVGFVLSAAIEATQAMLLPDRVPDVRDLVANTAGALLGAALVALPSRPYRPSHPHR